MADGPSWRQALLSPLGGLAELCFTDRIGQLQAGLQSRACSIFKRHSFEVCSKSPLQHNALKNIGTHIFNESVACQETESCCL